MAWGRPSRCSRCADHSHRAPTVPTASVAPPQSTSLHATPAGVDQSQHPVSQVSEILREGKKIHAKPAPHHLPPSIPLTLGGAPEYNSVFVAHPTSVIRRKTHTRTAPPPPHRARPDLHPRPASSPNQPSFSSHSPHIIPLLFPGLSPSNCSAPQRVRPLFFPTNRCEQSSRALSVECRFHSDPLRSTSSYFYPAERPTPNHPSMVGRS